MYSVAVLMSTYNGEKYIREQIESVLSQKDVNINLIIRDDGSTDNTISIIKDYLANDNVSFYSGDNLKPAKSFLTMINNVGKFDFYALCDQDDVWDVDKIIVAINKIKQKENNRNVPLLYYSNLRIVDQNLVFFRNSHLKPLIHSNKYKCICEPVVTGCTAVFNYELCSLLKYGVPNYCSMHDTWIYMVASLFGETIYDFEPHINYRQHSNNVIGTQLKPSKIKKIKDSFKRLFNRKLQPRFYTTMNFMSIYGTFLNESDKMKLNKILLYKKNFINTIKLMFDKDLQPTGILKKINFKILVFLRII